MNEIYIYEWNIAFYYAFIWNTFQAVYSLEKQQQK